MVVEPVVASSARKHGVEDADMLHAYRNPIRVFYPGEDLVLLIGPNRDGTDLLEIGFVEGSDGRVIVHSMVARDRYLR